MRASEFITERKKSRKKSRKSRRVSGYYFPGYGYYGGSGDSGEGGDGGGGESRSGMSEEAKSAKYNSLVMKYAFNDNALIIKAFDPTAKTPLAFVKFIKENKELYPQNLWTHDDYRNKSIAKSMYDFLKSEGYIINRSHDQTKAGSGFWDKHRGEDAYVWED